MAMSSLDAVNARLAEIYDLDGISALVEWDQLVMMRPLGEKLRGEAVGTLSAIVHQHWTDPEFGQALEAAMDEVAARSEDDPVRANVVVAKRHRDRLARVPLDLATDMSRHSVISHSAWVAARKNNDFATFAPYLEQGIDLRLRYIDCFEAEAHPYDTLLKQWDLEYTTAELTGLFDELKTGFKPIIAGVAANPDAVSEACFQGHFPKQRQHAMFVEFARALGARDDAWRLDETVHPFETAMNMNDVRITTRYYEDDIGSGFFGTLHETGHGLYEDGVDPALARTAIGRGGTLDMHESQSRMIENLVGRSRAFFDFALPIFQQHFPEKYGSLDAETLYRGANVMRPSFIRVEADEATYNMHIALRFELEQQLITRALKVRDLPEAWNAAMQDLLGVTPATDTDGVLQDIHWSMGSFGTFVGYTLGNVIGAQLWQLIERDLPDLYQQFSRGEFMPLREWLREHIHRTGRTFGTKTLLKGLGIDRLDPEPLRVSIAAKAAELYGI